MNDYDLRTWGMYRSGDYHGYNSFKEYAPYKFLIKSFDCCILRLPALLLLEQCCRGRKARCDEYAIVRAIQIRTNLGTFMWIPICHHLGMSRLRPFSLYLLRYLLLCWLSLGQEMSDGDAAGACGCIWVQSLACDGVL